MTFYIVTMVGMSAPFCPVHPSRGAGGLTADPSWPSRW